MSVVNQESTIFLPNQQLVDFGSFYEPPFLQMNTNYRPHIVGHDDGYVLRPDVSSEIEMKRSISLIRFMNDKGLVPSHEEEIRRRKAIDKLRKIVMDWSKRIAHQCRLPRSYIQATSAVILTYGSYGLGVHNCESDIDILCVGPCFTTMAESFFIVLRDMIASLPEVSDLYCVQDAKVPLMRFKLDGISVDLPYARFDALSISENMDVLDPIVLRNIDELSWKSLSGVRANRSILQLVPNLEIYQSLLRCVKFWTRRRGIYCSLLGFLGGVHLAVLSAFICLRHPQVHLSALVSIFFRTFTFWPWPKPVILEDGIAPINYLPVERSFMLIQLPCNANEYCYSNITKSTFDRITAEFFRGHALTMDIVQPDFDWRFLFEPFSYTMNYGQFLKIRLSSRDRKELGGWVGRVKSRFRCLILKLEELLGFCDPNPTEYIDINFQDPNIVFYWGLSPGSNQYIDTETIKENFLKNMDILHEGFLGKMELSLVNASEFPKTKTNNGRN